VKDITDISKKATLGFLHNSIDIITKSRTYHLTSISNRDNAFNLLTAIWKGTPVNFDPSAAVEPDEKGIDL
jgi:hypothetical protein